MKKSGCISMVEYNLAKVDVAGSMPVIRYLMPCAFTPFNPAKGAQRFLKKRWGVVRGYTSELCSLGTCLYPPKGGVKGPGASGRKIKKPQKFDV
jgi:hypothetical protein